MYQYGLRPTFALSLDEVCENDRAKAVVMAKTVSISTPMKEQPIKAARIGWRVLAALYATTFLVTLFLAYTGNLPPQFSQIPYYDKIGHVVLYGVAVYLGHRVFGYRRMVMQAIAVPLFPVLFAIGTVTEELLQSLSPNRTLDAIDLAASFLGIAVGYWLAEKGR